MEKHQKIRLPRLLVEGAAIVASILLAFWIDAWWDDRQNQINERTILLALHEEFGTLSEHIDWSRPYNEAIRLSARQLLFSGLGVAEKLDGQEIDELLADLWWNQELARYATPELDSVISSGDLSLISNYQVRRRIGIWPQRMELVRSTMQRDLDFYANRLMPFLAANAFLPQLVNVGNHTPGHPNILYDYGLTIEIKDPVSHEDLISNVEFQNILIERDILLTDILTLGFADIQDDLDATLILIEDELAK